MKHVVLKYTKTHTFSSIRSLSVLVEKGILSNGAGSSVLQPALCSSIKRLRPNNCQSNYQNNKIRIEIINRHSLTIRRLKTVFKHHKACAYKLHYLPQRKGLRDWVVFHEIVHSLKCQPFPPNLFPSLLCLLKQVKRSYKKKPKQKEENSTLIKEENNCLSKLILPKLYKFKKHL